MAGGYFMKSLTYKLVLIFLVVSIVPVVVGINAFLSLRTSFAALESSDNALRHLTGLLSSAGQSLAESKRLQDNANSVAEQVASSQNETSSALRSMAEDLLPKTTAISSIRFALLDASAGERALLLALNMRHLELPELKATREAQQRIFEHAHQTIKSARETYEARLDSREERQAWEDFVQALDSWWMNHNDFIDEVDKLDAFVEDLVRGGPQFTAAARKAYDTLFVSGREAREECERRIEVLNQTLARVSEANVQGAMRTQGQSKELLGDMAAEAEAATRRADALTGQFAQAQATARAASDSAEAALTAMERRLKLLMLLSIAGIAAALTIGIVMAARISRPIRNMAAHLDKLARGNITDDVPERHRQRNDEIGQLSRSMQALVDSNRIELGMANAMAKGDFTTPIGIRSEEDELGRALRSMLSTSSTTLLQVSRAVERVGNGLHDVTAASRSLSQGAQTSAQAVEEISQAVHNVDGQAKENAANARQANELATVSRDAARRGYDAVTELVNAMAEIRQAGGKIATVAKLIDDIAFQTNLLALNAAVEAARAGRQGKGFSVVADEVRNLSGRSARAARETSTMIAAMTERMTAGAELAEKSDSEFREIVEATSKVAQLFQDIADSSAAQSTAMAQVAVGLGQIDAVIQENTHNAGRTASSAVALLRQADMLRHMVARFKLVDEQEDPSDAALPVRHIDLGIPETRQLLSGDRSPDAPSV